MVLYEWGPIKKIYVFALFFCAVRNNNNNRRQIVTRLQNRDPNGVQTNGFLFILVILIRKLYKQFMPLSQFMSLPSLHIHCACDQQIRLPWIELEWFEAIFG